MKIRFTVDPAGEDKPDYVRAKIEAPELSVYGVLWVPTHVMAGARTWFDAVYPVLLGVDVEWAGSAIPVPVPLADQAKITKLLKLVGKLMPRILRMAGLDVPKRIGPGDAGR